MAIRSPGSSSATSYPRWPSTTPSSHPACAARVTATHPPGGYDKKAMVNDVHDLLVRIGHDKDIRLVGHDIGMTVAYAYTAAHPHDVAKLMLAKRSLGPSTTPSPH